MANCHLGWSHCVTHTWSCSLSNSVFLELHTKLFCLQAILAAINRESNVQLLIVLDSKFSIRNIVCVERQVSNWHCQSGTLKDHQDRWAEFFDKEYFETKILTKEFGQKTFESKVSTQKASPKFEAQSLCFLRICCEFGEMILHSEVHVEKRSLRDTNGDFFSFKIFFNRKFSSLKRRQSG